MKFVPLLGAMAISLVITAAPLSADAASPVAGKAGKVFYQPLPKPGEKVSIDAGHYFVYGFTKPPQLGTRVMRVEIFTRDGKRDTSLTVMGEADMPSMWGAHSRGAQAFSLSAKGIYLLPVWLVMPGDWEIRFTFKLKGKEIYYGSFLFKV